MENSICSLTCKLNTRFRLFKNLGIYNKELWDIFITTKGFGPHLNSMNFIVWNSLKVGFENIESSHKDYLK